MKIFGIIFLFFLATSSSAQTFDPKNYLKDQTLEQQKENQQQNPSQTLKYAEVKINGIPYYKFGTQKGSLLVVKLNSYNREVLERSACTERLANTCKSGDAGACSDPGVQDAIVLKAEAPLTEGLNLYASQIIESINRNCLAENTSKRYKNVDGFFRIGIEKRNKDPRKPGGKKGYIELGPGAPKVGGAVEF